MGSPQRSGRQSLRLSLLVLLLVPLLSLAALWALATFMASRDAVGRHEATTAYERISLPGAVLATALQRERASSAVLLSGGRGGDRLAADRAAVDSARAAFRRSALSAPARRSVSGTTEERLDDLLRGLGGLGAVRAQVDSGSADPIAVMTDYNAILDGLLRVYGSMAVIDDRDVYPQVGAIVAGTTAREMVTREDAVVAATLRAPRHVVTGPAYTMFAQSAYNERYLSGTALADLKTELRAPLERVAGSAEFAAFRRMEDAILAAGPGARLPVQAGTWRDTVTPLMTMWTDADKQAAGALSAQARPISDRITLFLYLATGLGLIAMIASIVVSVLFGRRLTRELSGLRNAALDLAQVRLPALVTRLRGGEKVDVDAETVPVEVGRGKEVADVADALNTLQRTAIEAAVGEARVRDGINQVFLSMAWRSQSLLHRQLRMLEGMEKQAGDPDLLDALFALDHLTTRMRRHAEGLVILAGAPPSRGRRHPVAIRDVLRAAVAEVEQYTRVVVTSAAPAALDGAVVADATHLLAEIVENATVFSPPTTRVRVHGEMVAKGYAVEVEDRGIGMEPEEYAEANERLANPPEFDLLDGDQLGLFIVARLAARHGIRVVLGPSAYGGTRAVVLIPLQVIDEGSESDDAWTDGPAGAAAPAVVRWREPAVPLPPAGAPRELAAPADGWNGWPGGPVVDDGEPDLEPWNDDDAPELPRRVRWASLAPQLRRDAVAPPLGGTPVELTRAAAAPVAGTAPILPPVADAPTTRPPEETRSLMSALQRGWRRGREAPEVDE